MKQIKLMLSGFWNFQDHSNCRCQISSEFNFGHIPGAVNIPLLMIKKGKLSE